MAGLALSWNPGRAQDGDASVLEGIQVLSLPPAEGPRPGTGFARAAGQWPADGAYIYGQTCGLCHATGIGPELLGRRLPALVIKSLVRNDRAAMPAFTNSELDEAALQTLAEWIAKSELPAQGAAGQGGAQ